MIVYIYYISLIPFPFYLGSSINGFGIDNCNIGFTLLILVLFPLIYRIAGFESKTSSLSFLLISIFFALLLCFLFKSLSRLFLVYEGVIITLFFIFFIFLPSFYRIRTAFFFFVFTIFGNCDNQNNANPLNTPLNILPE
jgi:hypothetical protein